MFFSCSKGREGQMCCFALSTTFQLFSSRLLLQTQTVPAPVCQSRMTLHLLNEVKPLSDQHK